VSPIIHKESSLSASPASHLRLSARVAHTPCLANRLLPRVPVADD